MLLSVPKAVHCLKHWLPLTSTELAPVAAGSLADWLWRLTHMISIGYHPSRKPTSYFDSKFVISDLVYLSRAAIHPLTKLAHILGIVLLSL